MKTGLIWLALPVLTVVTWLGLNAQGKAAAPAAVAFVSPQRIGKETPQGKATLARVQAAQQTHNTAIKARQDALEATRRQLAGTTAPESRARLQALGQQQTLELQSTLVKAQAEQQELARQANVDLLKAVQSAVADVVKDRQIQVVLNSETAVIWASPSIDLTDAVIARMNAAPPAPAKK
jgi:Skp family chaperone for outer membrane proteins